MSLVCFTGAGEFRGAKVTRDKWEALAAACGWGLVSAKSCDYLIASRDDTTKARDAKARGALVRDYTWFVNFATSEIGDSKVIDTLLGDGAIVDPWERAELERQAAADRVKKKREEHKAAQAAKEAELAELAKNPMFGMF